MAKLPLDAQFVLFLEDGRDVWTGDVFDGVFRNVRTVVVGVAFFSLSSELKLVLSSFSKFDLNIFYSSI